MTTAEQCGNCIQETASAHYFAERHHLQNAEQMYPASAICAQLSAELDDARAQTASLRSQLAECQRERDAEKYMTEHVNMPRLRALQQQLQQMKEALSKFASLPEKSVNWICWKELDEAYDAARALVSGNGE